MERYEQSELGNWNVAQDWSKELIFKAFYEASRYKIMAKFGCSDIEEEFLMTDEIKTQTKIRSIKWYRVMMEEGIRRCLFAIRSKDDKKIVQGFLDEIIKLEEVTNLVERKIPNRDSYVILINQEALDLALKVLDRIFTEVTEPMNRSDLIFNYREAFDPKEAKRKIFEDISESG